MALTSFINAEGTVTPTANGFMIDSGGGSVHFAPPIPGAGDLCPDDGGPRRDGLRRAPPQEGLNPPEEGPEIGPASRGPFFSAPSCRPYPDQRVLSRD